VSQWKPIAWSFSVLDSFETCPRRHNLTKVAKIVQQDPPSQQIQWGRDAHTALENRMAGTAPLPAALQHYEPLVQKLTSKHGKRLNETKFAIDKNFKPCSWRAPTTWCRVIVDTGIVGTTSAFLADWKTGNRKPNSDQLKLSAAVGFAHYPHLESIHTAFIWLKEKKLDSEMFTHEQVQTIWNDFLPRVKRLELAHQTNTWQPRPSGLCGKWCPVTKQHCEFGR
jgi:hypothetical protein